VKTEFSVSVEGAEYLDQPNHYHLLKMDPTVFISITMAVRYWA
jgi:hypothetical protein